MTATATAPEITLDSQALREMLQAEFEVELDTDPAHVRLDEYLPTLRAATGSGLASVVLAMIDLAYDEGMLHIPDDVQINAYQLPEDVIITVREADGPRIQHGIARQLASVALSAKDLYTSLTEPIGVDGHVDLAEAITRQAAGLLANLRVLQAA